MSQTSLAEEKLDVSELYAEKGRYCQFVQKRDGSYVLEPVKVPAHVKAARAEQRRRREMQRHARDNRERAQAVNARSAVFLAAALGFFVMVCCVFLAMQNQVCSRSNQITSLITQISELAEENDSTEKRIAASENLLEIETIAREKLGMQYVDETQIEYYAADDSDYMLQYDDIE
ncbi:MAG: septum formation initiator family protein [Clostridiales bacterium]|nr:septum formation initiator family protein [Clostridiales bacterium]